MAKRKTAMKTVMTAPPSMHKEAEAARIRSDRHNPACPKCGRRYAQMFFKPHHQKPSYECVCTISPPGCGHIWDAK